MIAVRTMMVAVLTGVGLFVLTGGRAEAQTAQLTKLTDINFGSIASPASDANSSQNVCAFAAGLSGRYGMRASGSGTGGTLTLSGGGASMPYEVQWAASSNQTSGTALPANTTVGGFADGLATVVDQSCSLLAATSASLIVIIRAATLNGATAGSYSGTLTLVIAPQ